MEQTEEIKNLKGWMVRRFESMKAERAKVDDARWEAYSIMDFRTRTAKTAGQYIHPQRLYSTDHILYLDTMVDGIMANLCSPSVSWFQILCKGPLGVSDDDIPGAKDWAEHAGERLMQHFNDSHFYPETRLAVKDAVVGGTSFEMVVDDDASGRIVHDTLDPQDCYIAEDAAHEVNVFFHDFTMTVRQAAGKFGEDELPLKLRRILDAGTGDEPCEFVHAIFPRDQLPPSLRGRIPAITKKWASVWLSVTADEVFRIGGYAAFPLAAHRWERDDASPYGIGLVEKLLPNLREYQYLMKMYGKAVGKQVDPPMYVPVALKGRFDFRPGSVNYGNPQSDGVPSPINTTLDLTAAIQRIQTVQNALMRFFYVDLFQAVALDNVQRTKYEVQRIEGRRLMLLAGVIGNMQMEKFDPLVELTLGYMIRNHRVLPVPVYNPEGRSPSVQVTVELDGLLAQNLKAYQQAAGLDGGISAIALLLKLYPAVAPNFDMDEIARQYTSTQGLPQSCIREKAEVRRIKEQMVANQQAAQRREDMLDASTAAKNMANANVSQLLAQQPDRMGGV